MRVRVLTYNIHHGEGMDGEFDLARLADIIIAARADYVVLQEVDDATHRSNHVHQATELGQLTGMRTFFGSAMDYDDGRYGEALLYGQNPVVVRNYALPHEPQHEPRAAVEGIVRKAGVPIFRIVGTHLDHTRNSKSRADQARQLSALFGRDDLPTILAGDLNATPDSGPMTTLFASFEASALELPTIPSAAPERKIDYVLFRPADQWRVISTEVLDEPIASDHCPLLVELELTY
jgi:endonuclease/exonuclease/phosphatase family metal-dependent hydrolase